MAAKVTITFGENNLEKLPVLALRKILSEQGIVNKKDKKRELVSTVRTVVLKEELVKVRGIEVLRILSILSHTHTQYCHAHTEWFFVRRPGITGIYCKSNNNNLLCNQHL